MFTIKGGYVFKGTIQVMCGRCGKRWAKSPPSTKSRLLCVECSICRLCDKPSDKLNVELFCPACICMGCGRGVGSKEKRNNEYGTLCANCYVKTHPDEACISCKARLGYYHQRGDKFGFPSVCEYCAGHMAPQADIGQAPVRLIWCFYCDGQADFFTNHHVGGKLYGIALCGDHGDKKSCGANGCNPSRQCKDCKSKQAVASNPEGHIKGIKGCPCNRCRYMQNLEVFFYENPEVTFHTAESRMLRRWNQSRRAAAAEIEVAGLRDRHKKIDIKRIALKWEMSGIVQDASLKDTGLQFEINTAPAAGDLMFLQIDEICEVLRSAGSYVDKSCGLHVHVDMRDHTYHDLKKFVLLYSKVEDALIRTQPFKRVYADRSHCWPCGKKYVHDLAMNLLPDEARKKLVSNIYDGYEIQRGRSYKGRPPRDKRGNNREIAARYNAVNLHSYFHRRTVEFRLHSGTIRPDKIKKWMQVCVALVDAAYSMSETEIRTLKGSADTILFNLIPPNCVQYLQNRMAEFGKPYGPIQTSLL